MIITGAFFANAANVSNGTLNVLGGVWDTYDLPEGQDFASMVLVVLVQLNPDDEGGGSVAMEVFGPDGAQVGSNVLNLALGAGENGFGFAQIAVQIPQLGRYSFVLSAGSANISLSLVVRRAV